MTTKIRVLDPKREPRRVPDGGLSPVARLPLPGEMPADKLPGVGQRVAAVLQPRIPDRPRVNHLRPYFEADPDIG